MATKRQPLTPFSLRDFANCCNPGCGLSSCNEPVAGGDWVGRAQALMEHGLPRATLDPDDPDWVLIDGRRKRFSDEVKEVLLTDDSL